MEILSDKEFTKVWYGLLGIPTIDEQDFAKPIAKKLLEKYEAGLLSMTEKQFTLLKHGLMPTAHISTRELPKPKIKL